VKEVRKRLAERDGRLKILDTRKNDVENRHREERPTKRRVGFSSISEGTVRQLLVDHQVTRAMWRGEIKAEAFSNYLTVPRQVPKFDWKENETERYQMTKAVEHLDNALRQCGLPTELFLLNITGNNHLFDVLDSKNMRVIPTGTADAVIVAADQKDEDPMCLHSATFLVFEFKKKVDPVKDYRQAGSTLIGVDGVQSASRFPVVVLTDLRDNFVFFWFGMHRSERKLFHYKASSFRIASLLMCTLAIEEARKEDYVESHPALSNAVRSFPWFVGRFKFATSLPLIQLGGDDSKQEAGDVAMGDSESGDTAVLPTGGAGSQRVLSKRKKLTRRDDDDENDDKYHKYREAYVAAWQYLGTWNSDVQRPMSSAADNMFL